MWDFLEILAAPRSRLYGELYSFLLHSVMWAGSHATWRPVNKAAFFACLGVSPHRRNSPRGVRTRWMRSALSRTRFSFTFGRLNEANSLFREPRPTTKPTRDEGLRAQGGHCVPPRQFAAFTPAKPAGSAILVY